MVTPGWFFRMPVIVAPVGAPRLEQSELKLLYEYHRVVKTSVQTECGSKKNKHASATTDEGVHAEPQFGRDFGKCIWMCLVAQLS